MIRSLFARALQALLRRLGKAGAHDLDAELGPRGEDIAYWYLREHGFTLVARNYRRAGVGGEVDLIGWDSGTLVFVEVKTRQSAGVRAGEDAVDFEKRCHLVEAARDYRRRAHVEAPYRFDVVTVYPGEAGRPVVEHFRDAFCEASTAAGN